MDMIRNKLREKNGASIFMGLIFLLMCLMVGTVVLVAASAAAGKLAQQRKSEQEYLNVASAARLVRDRICKSTYKYEKKGHDLPKESLTASDGGAVILVEELKGLCGILAENGTKDSSDLQTELDGARKNFKIKLDSASSGVEWETVYGRVSMKTDGRLIVELWLGDSDRDDEDNHNFVEIEFSPSGPVRETKVESKEVSGVIVETSTKTVTCSWPEAGCTITKGR